MWDDDLSINKNESSMRQQWLQLPSGVIFSAFWWLLIIAIFLQSASASKIIELHDVGHQTSEISELIGAS